MQVGKLVHVVDDDEAIRRTITRMAGSAGYSAIGYASGDEFLAAVDSAEPGCVILDLQMPGADGLQVQRAMEERQSQFPVLVLTGHADVGSAVAALKGGAVDFLQKPLRRRQLIDALDSANRRLDEATDQIRRRNEAQACLDRLSPREVDSLEQLRKGLSHKMIAHNLGISVRTVEVHRASILRKFGVRSLSEALQIVFDAA